MSKKKRRRKNRPQSAGGQRSRATGNPARAPGNRTRSAAGRSDPAPSASQLTAPGTAGAAHDDGPSSAADAQIQVIVGLITTGALDVHLGTLQAAISKRHQDRRRDASHQAAAELRIGDRVSLTEYIRPMYMRGATGTLTGWAQQNAIVHLDQPTGRFPGGEIRCPPLGLRRLEPSA